ncbi:MAG: deoxyribose-phosphate aldolase [Firmicutes bacterium]|nr:deoxyribose-phosphate aldolase [Bacillota bacterium]
MNKSLNKYIDHTLLRPDATKAEIEKLCKEALEYDFYSVCVNSYWVPFCASLLEGSDVNIAAVVGFPLGAMSTESKVYETHVACREGANEIDMVMNIGALKSGNLEAVEDDIRQVVNAAKEFNAIVKVILETGLLTNDEIVTACKLSENAGAAFVKTSTGFGHGGAELDKVKLMRASVSKDVSVKASGGIRDKEAALAMIDAGADRIGTSSGMKIVSD